MNMSFSLFNDLIPKTPQKLIINCFTTIYLLNNTNGCICE